MRFFVYFNGLDYVYIGRGQVTFIMRIKELKIKKSIDILDIKCLYFSFNSIYF